MLNTGRGRRREHPNQHFVLRKARENNVYICSQLPVKREQLLVAHAHTLPPLRVMFGSHGTCTTTRVRKKTREPVVQLPVTHAHTITFGQVLFRSRGSQVTHVISGEKALIRQILYNFRLRISYFRTGPLPVT